jgi:hypothetical protein
MPIDYDQATAQLSELFAEAENAFQVRNFPSVAPAVEKSLQDLFTSGTQAYRETLVGSVIARLQDKSIDLRLPYKKQGKGAYNARDLDQRSVNPFLKTKQIPSTKGPFLSVFRRGVKFTRATKKGVRDTGGYGSFLNLVDYLRANDDDDLLRALLKSLLYRFIELREASKIEVAKVQRLSMSQYPPLIDGLMAIKSGGRFPVFLVVATLRAMNNSFSLGWKIQHQGINVADAAHDEPGDITIVRNERIFIAAEVTERVVDQARVVSTFTGKIAPAGVQDYIFFVRFRASGPDPDALRQAQQYFAQGHEVNFVDIKSWVLQTLSTIGKEGRLAFNAEMATLLDGNDVPRRMKVGWNEQIQKLTRV